MNYRILKNTPLSWVEGDANFSEIALHQNGLGYLSQEPLIQPNPQVSLVNGASSVVGSGFEDGSANALNIGAEYKLVIKEGGNTFLINIDTITDANNAVIASHFNITNDPEQTTNLGVNWTGQSGQFVGYAAYNVLQGDANYGAKILGIFNFSSSKDDKILGNENILIGSGDIKGDSNKILQGFGHKIEGNGNTINSANAAQLHNCESCTIQSSGQNNAMAYCAGGTTLSSTKNRVLVLNIHGDLIDQLNLSDTVVLNSILALYIAEYADEAAAAAAGLHSGQFYKTSTGELRIKL